MRKLMIAVALAATGAITSANAQTFPHKRSTPGAQFQKAEIEKWWPVINAAGIKVQ